MEMNNDLTINDLSVKFKSKTELYKVLVQEGSIYLPPKQDSTQKILRSIMLGSKLYVKWGDVAVVKVPQYKGLHVKDLLRFAATKINIKKYLPDYEYCKEPNREWLCNLLNTLLGKDFQDYIKERIELRKRELIESKNLGVYAKDEFVNIFKKSQAVSSMKGKSHFLVRMPRDTKEKKIINNLEEEKKGSDTKVRGLVKEIDDLRLKIQQLEDNQLDNEDNLEKLSNLYKLGIIDENGQPIDNRME